MCSLVTFLTLSAHTLSLSQSLSCKSCRQPGWYSLQPVPDVSSGSTFLWVNQIREESPCLHSMSVARMFIAHSGSEVAHKVLSLAYLISLMHLGSRHVFFTTILFPRSL